GGRDVPAHGEEALEPLPGMCCPPAEPPSKEEVARAVRQLGDAKTRRQAIPLLALGKYPRGLLGELLAREKGDTLLYGLAIRKWREQEPWFMDGPLQLLDGGTTMLEVYWPLDKLRAFALTKLDRMARAEEVEHITDSRPLMPLLGSVRYSPDPKERDLLAGFLRKARPGAARTAHDVMEYGLVGRIRHDMAPHWKDLPPHKYNNR